MITHKAYWGGGEREGGNTFFKNTENAGSLLTSTNVIVMMTISYISMIQRVYWGKLEVCKQRACNDRGVD